MQILCAPARNLPHLPFKANVTARSFHHCLEGPAAMI